MSTFEAEGDSNCCALTSFKILRTYKYAKGSIVYSIANAKKGILEPIAIKNVRFNSKLGMTSELYIDTYNSFWFGYELCIQSEAAALAISYLEREEAKIISAMQNCTIPQNFPNSSCEI